MATKIGKIAKATKGLKGKIPTAFKVAGAAAAAYGIGRSLASLKTKREREKMPDGTVRKKVIREGQVGNVNFRIEKDKTKNPAEGQKTKTRKITVETPSKQLKYSKTKGQKPTYNYKSE